MKPFKKLCLAALAGLALGCGTASANVTEHVHLGLQTGAAFDGDITFADQYLSIVGADGYLDDGANGTFHLISPFDAAYLGTPYDATHATGITGEVTDFLVDGDPLGNYSHSLGITWLAPAASLNIDIGQNIATDYAGLDTSDRIVSVTVGATSTPSNVPEPASMVLLGLGLAGLAIARRRRA